MVSASEMSPVFCCVSVIRPNDATVPLLWPRYNATDDMNLNISLPLSVTSGLKSTSCDFWDYVMKNISSIAS